MSNKKIFKQQCIKGVYSISGSHTKTGNSIITKAIFSPKIKKYIKIKKIDIILMGNINYIDVYTVLERKVINVECINGENWIVFDKNIDRKYRGLHIYRSGLPRTRENSLGVVKKIKKNRILLQGKSTKLMDLVGVKVNLECLYVIDIPILSKKEDRPYTIDFNPYIKLSKDEEFVVRCTTHGGVPGIIYSVTYLRYY